MDTLLKTAPHPRRHLALVVLLAAAVMNLIDGTILNVALPAIQSDLRASATQIEWVSVIYLLAFATGLLPFGRFGDVFGRRRIFAWGVAGFTLASGICGLSPNIETLVTARLVQGLSGAAMIPQVLALMRVVFPPEEQSAAFSKFTLVSSLSAVSGPLIGGIMLQADLFGLGWRSIFLVNLPIGAAILASLSLVAEAPLNEKLKTDIVGIALFSSSVVALVLPIIEGRSLGWPWWTFASIVVGLALGVVFIVFELQQDRAGSPQLLPGSLIRNRKFTTGLVHIALLFAVPPGLILVLGVYLQIGLGLSALQAGFVISPFPAGVMVASLVTGKMPSSSQMSRIILGVLVIMIAMALLALAVRSTSSVDDAWRIALPVLLAGFGMGISVVALYPMVLGAVPSGDAGAGSGALQALQHVGVVLGMAATAEVFFATLGTTVRDPYLNVAVWSSAATNAAAMGLAIMSVLFIALIVQKMIGAGR